MTATLISRKGAVMRAVIDFVAILISSIAGISATDSNVGGVVLGGVVALYGFWCFHDGRTSR